MTTHTHPLEIRVDRKGTVEISGLTRGENEAIHLADELGFESYEPVNFLYTAIRVTPLAPEALAALREKAAGLGYHLTDVEDLGASQSPRPKMALPQAPGGEEASTISVLHQHALTPSRKMKLVLPLIFAGALAVLVVIGGIIRDHLTRSYNAVPSFAQVMERAARPPAAQSAIGKFLDPDDSRYVSVTVVAWPHWEGKSAVVEGAYVQVPRLHEKSLEDLVKGDRGAAALTFQIDLGRTEGNTYHVDRILRDAQPTSDVDLDMSILPITEGSTPAVTQTIGGSGYLDGAGLRYDRDNTFKGVKEVAVSAFVAKTAEGYQLRSESFAMALEPPRAPAVAALLEDLAVDPSVLDRAFAGKLPADQKLALNHRRATWFGVVEKTFPWTEAGKPGRRQLTHEIGLMSLDGVQLRKLYLRNA
jgi:hypothetical protein